MFTDEPRDVEVGCGTGQMAEFPCMFSGSVAHPYWIINSTEYVSIHLPQDYLYSSYVLKVSNVNEKNGSQYQCFILSNQNGAVCAYSSTIGRLILNCKGKTFSSLFLAMLHSKYYHLWFTGFNIQSSPIYRYDSIQTLKEIYTTITQVLIICI